jgi:uncharacterized coiled-coil protein SlyX
LPDEDREMIACRATTVAGLEEGLHPMADDEQSTSGAFAGLIEEYFAQLRAVTERLQNLAGSGPQPQPAPGGLPLPGALSAAQLASITDSIAAQRRSIEALKAQLSSFDEQLAALEQILGPLAQWGSRWAELEQRLLNLPRPPGTGGPARSLSGNGTERSHPPMGMPPPQATRGSPPP